MPSTWSVNVLSLKQNLTGFSGTMCADDIPPCGVPFCRSSGAALSSHSLHDDEAKSVSNIDFQHLCAPHYSLSFPAVVSPSPTSGRPLVLFDQSFKGARNPDCTQQPPNYVIDHWFHRLGPSVEAMSSGTISNSATVSPLFKFSMRSALV